MKTEHLTIAIAVLCVAYGIYVVHNHAGGAQAVPASQTVPAPSQAVVDEQYRLHYQEELALRSKQLDLQKSEQRKNCMVQLRRMGLAPDDIVKLCNAEVK